MSISVEGQKCPVCKSYMFDDEDIVFCPVCGVPSHRECYNSVGKCPLEEYHGTELEYKAPKTEEKPAEEESKQEKTEESKSINERIDFSNTDEPNAMPFANGNAPFYFNAFDPYGGVNKDENIEGFSAEEIKNAVGVNSQYYIPKFIELKQKKTCWNWAAFLIPESFFFYRKCHKVGILAFLITVASTALMYFPNLYLTVTENMTQQEMVNAMMVIFNDPQKFLFSSIAITLGLIIAIISRVIFGLYGNYLYKKEIFDKIKAAREDTEHEPALTLKLKGGTNLFLGMLGLWGVNFAVRILFLFL